MVAAMQEYVDLAMVRDARSVFKDWHDKVDSLTELQPDWDTFGAARISDMAVARAHSVLRFLEGNALVPPSDIKPIALVPVASGGVQIEWTTPRAEMEIEISPHGSIVLVVTQDRFPPVTVERDVDEQAILDQIIELVSSYASHWRS